MDSEQQSPAPQKTDKNDQSSAAGRSAAGPARVIVVAARLWAYGGQQRKLRDFAWQPESAMARWVESLARGCQGKITEAANNLLTLSFDDPLQAVTAAKILQQNLLDVSQRPDAECVAAAVAVYAPAPVKPQKRRSYSSAESDDLRRPLKEADLTQILVSEEIYKQVKDAPGFKFSDRPSRAAGGSRPTELMYGLQWASGHAYSEMRQAIHEASMPRFSRYKIASELGRGTMGVVYKAHDQSIDRMVALKTISLSSSGSGRELEESVERLRQEAKAAGSLDHPNIITIYDVGQEDGFFYLSMQFVEGSNLSAMLANGRLQPLSTVLSYIDQICAAVGFAHQRGIVHRDLKPSNIMLTGQGTIKVLDFGIAKLGNASMTQAGMVVGTPSYMAPEQAMGRKVDQRSDIFALGAVFYEFFTGKRPFIAQDVTAVLYKVVHEEPTPPAAVEPLLPMGIDAIVRRALAKAPQDRFQSCEEMREAFREQAALLAPNAGARTPVARSAPPVRVPPAPSTTTRSRAVPPPRSRKASWSVVFSLLAGAALAGGFFFGRARLKARAEAALAEQAKPPAVAESVKPEPSTSSTVVPDAKAAADSGKAQPAGTQEPAAGTATPTEAQTQPAVGTTASGTKPGPPDAAAQSTPPPAAGTPASGTAAPPADSAPVGAADSDTGKPQPAQDDADPAATSKPTATKSRASRPASGGSIDGFSRADIPALLRKADAAAGRGEYAVAKYEYSVILRLDRRNPGALAGLRRVVAAEKEKK